MTAEQMTPEEAWQEVEGCIMEIEWFVSRKKDLAKPSNEQKAGEEIWADVLAADIKALREALAAARGLS